MFYITAGYVSIAFGCHAKETQYVVECTEYCRQNQIHYVMNIHGQLLLALIFLPVSNIK